MASADGDVAGAVFASGPPVPPRYGAGSLADVLPGVLAALGVPGVPDPLGLATGALAGVRRVAVLLLDGLGYHQVPLAVRYAPTLADLAAGRLGAPAGRLTVGFPSTTPASLTSLTTGLPPGGHGIIGFTVNVPGTDQVLNHIQWTDDPDPYRWQPVDPLLARALATGVAVSVVNRPEFAGTGLTSATVRGVPYRGASTTDEIAAAMLADLAAGPGPALVYGYLNEPDSSGHAFGVASPHWVAAVTEADRLLARLVDGLPAGAALVVVADHGQINVPPECRFDLAVTPELAAGVRVVAGEPRVRYVHPVPGAAGDVLDAWRAVLGGAAWVAPRDEVVATGWFGPVPPEHLARIGDVVAVCRDRYAIFATGQEPRSFARLIALHGSTTPGEMEIPLLVARG